jgi:tRNA/rRNA methyltransferase
VFLLERLVIVLHQVQSPDNLGAVARLMANFGVSELILSDPVTYDFRDAERIAVKADHFIHRPNIAANLAEALDNCVYACGTTSRAEVASLDPPDVALQKLAEASARGKVALVFGGERRGLSNEELSLCQGALLIPTRPEQPSMNLSHAVAVLLYLCAQQAAPKSSDSLPKAALFRQLRILEEVMFQALAEADFLNPQGPEPILRELWRSLARAELTEREAELWINAFKHLKRSASPPPKKS